VALGRVPRATHSYNEVGGLVVFVPAGKSCIIPAHARFLSLFALSASLPFMWAAHVGGPSVEIALSAPAQTLLMNVEAK